MGIGPILLLHLFFERKGLSSSAVLQRLSCWMLDITIWLLKGRCLAGIIVLLNARKGASSTHIPALRCQVVAFDLPVMRFLFLNLHLVSGELGLKESSRMC